MVIYAKFCNENENSDAMFNFTVETHSNTDGAMIEN